MPTIDEMFPKRHLTVEDLQGKAWTLEIAAVRKEKVFVPKLNQIAEKWVIQFKGAHKYFIINKTISEQIAAITGSRNTDDWVGKMISIFPDEHVRFGAEMVTAIRARQAANGADKPPASITSVEDEDEI